MANTSLTWTPSGAGNQQKTTLSMWLKKSVASNAGYVFEVNDGSNQFVIRESNAQLKFWHFSGSAYDWEAEMTPLLRDVNGWYNFVMSIDTTQSTLANRLKCWLNGVSQTVTFTSGSSNLSQNSNWIFNKNSTHRWGRADNSYWNGSMSHLHQTDGYCYDASTFGSIDNTTGEWQINAAPTIANYGTNGYFILKDGNSVTDQSPNTNNFTVATGTLTKSEDNPSNVFATLNPLDKAIVGTQPTIANGNLKWTASGNSSSNGGIRGTIGASSGKFYYEAKLTTQNQTMLGYHLDGVTPYFDGTGYIGASSKGFYGIYSDSGTAYAIVNGTNQNNNLGSISDNDIIGVAFDLDNGKYYFSKNGSWLNSGSPTSGSTGTGSFGNLPSGTYVPILGNASWTFASSAELNFGNGYFGTTAVSSAGTNASGNGIFEYDVPTGYTALSTKGLNL